MNDGQSSIVDGIHAQSGFFATKGEVEVKPHRWHCADSTCSVVTGVGTFFETLAGEYAHECRGELSASTALGSSTLSIVDHRIPRALELTEIAVDPIAATAHSTITAIDGWLRNEFGRAGWNDANAGVRAIIHEKNDPHCVTRSSMMVLHLGMEDEYMALEAAELPEAIAHEYFHGVAPDLSPLAVEEQLSDVAAKAFLRTIGHPVGFTSMVGEGAFKVEGFGRDYARDMAGGRVVSLETMRDYVTETNGSGNPHVDAGYIGKAFFAADETIDDPHLNGRIWAHAIVDDIARNGYPRLLTHEHGSTDIDRLIETLSLAGRDVADATLRAADRLNIEPAQKANIRSGLEEAWRSVGLDISG